jgi:DmsE family decaheme c-type cytochrome
VIRSSIRLVVSGVAVVAVGVLAALVLPAPAQKAPAPPSVPALPPADLPPGYVGAAVCAGCHEDSIKKLEGTRMGRLFIHQPRSAVERTVCETCHGPGKAHVDAAGGDKGDAKLITFGKKDRTPVEERNRVCLSCHRAGQHLLWTGSAHDARDVPCTGCHKVMENVSPKHQLARPTELETCGTCHLKERALHMRSSHMPVREGKMTCTSCHNPHGTVTPSLLKEVSLNNTCFTCHAEKRGPFLWVHAPVNESCANCHDPHGSNHESMLKVAKPRLCQQCHIETRHPTSPYGRDTGSLKFVMGRACVSCHSVIHGSNHPSGFAFTR